MTGMGNVIDGAESRGNVLGQTITTSSPDACRPGKDQRRHHE
jgi:hypothetical protein